MNNDVAEYNQATTGAVREICEALNAEISAVLSSAESKLYHANPVWFIDNNPIVGYDVADDHVNLLFWSGQSFDTNGLTAAGKFKAAGTKYTNTQDINIDQLRAWLKESATSQWNYRDLRAHNGELVKL